MPDRSRSGRIMRSLRSLAAQPLYLAGCALGLSVVVTAVYVDHDLQASPRRLELSYNILYGLFSTVEGWRLVGPLAVGNLVVLPLLGLLARRRKIVKPARKLFWASRMVCYNTSLMVFWYVSILYWFAWILLPVLVLLQVARVCHVLQVGEELLGAAYLVYAVVTLLLLGIVELLTVWQGYAQPDLAPSVMMLAHALVMFLVGYRLSAPPPSSSPGDNPKLPRDVYRRLG